MRSRFNIPRSRSTVPPLTSAKSHVNSISAIPNRIPKSEIFKMSPVICLLHCRDTHIPKRVSPKATEEGRKENKKHGQERDHHVGLES
ncbi:hypothetical protein BJX99DRAFT_231049 [Aspergillus californicus]